ncbi:STAS domain-containing protein [Streptomyces sp. NPDC007084]|uniref:STAS domain-containing protein n=1 Tax=Streptomyces sp. NPDC007084 TaxID=3154313 RepID=UPI00345302FF
MTETDKTAQDSRLSVEFSMVDGVRIVALRGEIDHNGRGLLGEALLPSADATNPRTVADLGEVTFMDSSGINILIVAHRAAEDAGGWLRLAAPQQAVLRVLQLVGVDTVISCHPTLQQALEDTAG